MFDRDDDRECKVCDALIPENQTFCARHYQEALLRFEEESLKYERALDEWESMTPAERARRALRPPPAAPAYGRSGKPAASLPPRADPPAKARRAPWPVPGPGAEPEPCEDPRSSGAR